MTQLMKNSIKKIRKRQKGLENYNIPEIRLNFDQNAASFATD